MPDLCLESTTSIPQLGVVPRQQVLLGNIPILIDVNPTLQALRSTMMGSIFWPPQLLVTTLLELQPYGRGDSILDHHFLALHGVR